MKRAISGGAFGGALALLSFALSGAALAAGERQLLDDFTRPELWRAAPASGVSLTLAGDRGPGESAATSAALRLDFDFQGRGGWAAAQRPLPLALPENWELRFRLRAEAPVNHLEVKLVDPSGDNVWWSVRRDYAFPREWSELRIKKRQVSFAWGPLGGGEPREIGAFELAVTAGSGGAGAVWISDLELVALPPAHEYAGTPALAATTELPAGPARYALDGERTTAWRAGPGSAALRIDFGETRELGGLTLHWLAGGAPDGFDLEASEDGATFTPLRSVRHVGALRSDLRLPEAEARVLRLRLHETPHETALAEIEVRPLAFGASPNSFVAALAAEAPRGDYPRAFRGEQVYWTVVGADGDVEESLFSEDGAIELGDGKSALEPFLLLTDRGLLTWAEVTPRHSLADGELPIPTVEWSGAGLRLEMTALATGEPGASSLWVRYRLTNLGAVPRRATLLLALRPFQANPPQQFLGRPGGVTPLGELGCVADGVSIGGARAFTTAPSAASCGVTAFDEGALVARLRRGELPSAREAVDETGLASGVLAWPFELAAGARGEVVVAVPYHAGSEVDIRETSRGTRAFEERLAREKKRWHQKLDLVELDLPENDPLAAALVPTLRANLGFVLVHRDGPAIQPGSRAYARSWIRDGALTGEALLRLGRTEVAREFAEWFATFQYPDGKVPCCVDRRGADPVPENDSHGELIHLIYEVYRYSGDRAFGERLLPAVERAVAAIDRLRGERRTAEYTSEDRRAFFGLLPESISHEGYSAKPMHSYWDDGFAYRGLADATDLATALGRAGLATRFATSRDEFRADLLASLSRTMQRHGIDYLPGCVELGDFDSTSTTALLAPGGLGEWLPRAALEETFERYHREFVARREGHRSWEVYTPYELRHVGAYVRLGWRERAGELLEWFLRDRRPEGWRAWAEVVGREERTARYLGDLPHGWVASDFIRSTLDLFAYEQRDSGTLVLAAGVPERWLDRPQGIAVRGLRTPWGRLDYRLTRTASGARYELGDALVAPPGGLLLTWPFAGHASAALVDGRPVALDPSGGVRVHRLPAVVDLQP